MAIEDFPAIILEVHCLQCRRFPCACAGGVEAGEVVTSPPAAEVCRCGHARGEHGAGGECLVEMASHSSDWPCVCAGNVEALEVVCVDGGDDVCVCGHLRCDHDERGACRMDRVNICTDWPCNCTAFEGAKTGKSTQNAKVNEKFIFTGPSPEGPWSRPTGTVTKPD